MELRHIKKCREQSCFSLSCSRCGQRGRTGVAAAPGVGACHLPLPLPGGARLLASKNDRTLSHTNCSGSRRARLSDKRRINALAPFPIRCLCVRERERTQWNLRSAIFRCPSHNFRPPRRTLAAFVVKGGETSLLPTCCSFGGYI